MDLLQRKHYRSFSHIDYNRDGYIDRADVMALGERVLNAFKVSPDSAKGKKLVATFESFWDSLVTHWNEDADGRVDPEEYHRGMTRAYVTGGDFERVFLPAIKAVVEIIDTDDDGELSIDEFRAYQRAFGTPPDQIETAFRALDTNGSGTLTNDELITAAREFYVEGDENARGNFLYGAI